MLSAHLAVIKNPFSTAVPTAKVPDGRSPTSLSTRWHVSNSKSSKTGKFLFCLQPSATCPLIVSGVSADNTVVYEFQAGPTEFAVSKRPDPLTVTSGTPPTAAPASAALTIPDTFSQIPVAVANNITGQSTNFPFGAAEVGPKSTLNNNQELRLVTSQNSPEKWRLVSQGLRLTPINNAELNSGWFEAIRVPSSYNIQECAIVSASDPANAPSCISVDLKSFEGGIAFASNWANYPGYISGKVRDLPRHVFYLQTVGDRNYHDANDINDCSAIGDEYARFQSSVEDIEGYIDTTFDTVLIRINGIPSTSDAQVPAIHYHSVSNLEHIQQANSLLKRFESRCISADGVVKKTDVLINRDPKPSIIRLYKE